MKNLVFCVVLVSLCGATQAAAQCSLAPADYSPVCTEMQGHIGAFNAMVSSQWNYAKGTTAFGTELLSANDNIGLQAILASNALIKVQNELDGLARVGVQFVTVGASFPFLYQPFFAYNNDPQDYAAVLSFYQNVMAMARAHGMKVLIEATVVFPNYATDVPLSAYYATLSTSDFTNGRAQVAQIVAQQLQPDWLNLGSEPDTISSLIGLPAEFTAQEWAAQISTTVSQLRAAGINGKPLIGAGCGAWQQNGSDYVSALMSTGIDYFDLHTFSVNVPAPGATSYLYDAVTYLDMAIAAGKGTAISETWDHKVTDAQLQGLSEYGILSVLATAEPLNDYSFWAPQDAEYLGEVINLAYWKHLLYVSPFESELFFANVDYYQNPDLDAAQLSSQEFTAEAFALNAGTLTPLGQWYSAAIKPANATTISAAWNSGAAGLAAASIVSIYGVNLAGKPESSTPGMPLANTLAGASAVVTDAAGVQTQLPLFFASPSQINAAIPNTVATGPAVIAITTPSGVVDSPVDLNPVGPGLFTPNETGAGVAAAQFVNGAKAPVDIFDSPCALGNCQGVPLDVSSGNTALVLYGTGIQNRTVLSDVTVTIGSLTLPAFYAGPAPGFVGEDQVNVYLPASLAGSGTVNITVSVAGTESNVVTATFQ